MNLFMDYPDDSFGFVPDGPPLHREGVNVCPCLECVRSQAIGSCYQAQTEAVRFVLYLMWLRWVVAEEMRKHWPAAHTANPKKLEKEKYRKRQTDDRG